MRSGRGGALRPRLGTRSHAALRQSVPGFCSGVGKAIDVGGGVCAGDEDEAVAAGDEDVGDGDGFGDDADVGADPEGAGDVDEAGMVAGVEGVDGPDVAGAFGIDGAVGPLRGTGGGPAARMGFGGAQIGSSELRASSRNWPMAPSRLLAGRPASTWARSEGRRSSKRIRVQFNSVAA